MKYKNDDSKKSYEGELGINYLKIKQGSQLQYKFSNKEDADKSTLLIQKADTKEKVKELVLDDNSVETSIPQGKYIYNFLIEWKNGSAKFIKLIEVE